MLTPTLIEVNSGPTFLEIQSTRRGLFASEPILLLATVIATLYLGRAILIPFALALTLNFLLAPAVIYLHRFRIRRVPAVILVVMIAGSVIGGVGWVVLRQLLLIADDLPAYRQNLNHKIEQMHAPATGAVGKAISGVREVGQDIYGVPAGAPTTSGNANQPATPLPTGKAGRVFGPAPVTPAPVVVMQPSGGISDLIGALAPVVQPLGETVFVLVLTVYMLIKREDLHNRLLLLAGLGRLNLVTQALDDAGKRISRFLSMNFMVNAGYGICFGFGLFLIGIPNATLWGVIAGTLRFVPYIGASIGVLLPFVFSLGVFSSWGPALVVLALFALLEFSVSNFLEPWLYGTHTGISTLALLIMAVFWTMLWGWPGLVLSTPLTVCLIVMGLHLPQMSFLHILLGDDAVLAPEVKFYERLLAMDQNEAHKIAEEFTTSHTLGELYDTLLLPTLALAEEDRHKGSLEEVRANFVFQCAKELIAEMTDPVLLKADGTPDFPVSQVHRTFPIVCVSTQDQADEIVATMLAQLLELGGNRSLQLHSSALSDEILARLSEEKDTVICISALPPFAFADTRALCQRIRQRLPGNRIIVGLWDSASDTERIRERLSACRPDGLVTNLGETVNLVKGWQCASQSEWQPQEIVAELALRGPANA
jgi:predicted PurR-regulated permease PerM